MLYKSWAVIGYFSLTCKKPLLIFTVDVSTELIQQLRVFYITVMSGSIQINSIFTSAVGSYSISCTIRWIMVDISVPTVNILMWSLKFIISCLIRYLRLRTHHDLKGSRQEDCQYAHDEVLYVFSWLHQLCRAVMHDWPNWSLLG